MDFANLEGLTVGDIIMNSDKIYQARRDGLRAKAKELATRFLEEDGTIPLFTYGALLYGLPESNHLKGCPYVGKASIQGYTLHDLGNRAGIIPHCMQLLNKGDGRVMGEVRLIDSATLEKLHKLMDEGTTYDFVETTMWLDGDSPYAAFTYVYTGDEDYTSLIPEQLQPYSKVAAMKNTHVWYVGYGHHMSFERLVECLQSCEDKTLPVDVAFTHLPNHVYFGGEDLGQKGGLAFLDITKPGESLGRAYLISRKQYDHIRNIEGQGEDRYPDEINLGTLSGIPMVTITNSKRHPSSAPNEDYLACVRRGLDEILYAGCDFDVEEYLEKMLNA